MELKPLAAIGVLFCATIAVVAQTPPSTINPAIPVAGTPVEQSGPALRQNFLAAMNDINTLYARAPGGGTVTNVVTSSPLFGGPITGAGTIGLGNLLLSNFNSALGATPTTFWRGDGTWAAPAGGAGTVTSVGSGTGLTGGPITGAGTLALANTTVIPGSYLNTNLTVDAQGRITAAGNGGGSGGGGTVTNITTTAPITGGPITTTGAIGLANTAVTPGSYTNSSITVDAQGRLTAASSGVGSGRVRLTGNLNLFADFIAGNDANACTSAGAGNACKTVQGAYTKLANVYDTAAFNITIQFNNNDTTGLLITSPWIGGGILTIVGPGGTPATIGLSSAGGAAINVSTTLPGALILDNMKLTGAFGLLMNSPGLVRLGGGINFGAADSVHIYVFTSGASVVCTGGYTISGGAFAHYLIGSGTINCSNQTFALLGTPAFSIFAEVDNSGSSLLASGNTYNGPATGQRYLVSMNGSINTNGGPFPGSIAGATSSGGQFQ